MKTLAIIVSYNFMPWIDRCLPSLLQSCETVDVLVIDNASKDETVAHIRELYPQVRLISNTENLGFGRANNIGMQIALDEGYDGVLLINQDAWLQPDALAQLVAASLQHPDFGIISPIHLTGDGSKLDPGFAKYIENRKLKIENYSLWNDKKKPVHPDGNAQSSMLNVQFINAALWYLPTSVIRKVGLFAPLFYHYGEDKDYVNRLHYHGYQIGYVPTAFGHHDRAERPFTRELFLRTERVYHLSEYANINHAFPKAFAYGVLAPVKKAFQALAKGKVTDSLAFLGISFHLLAQSTQVYEARVNAKKG